jgi:hypothetical protein
MYSRVTQLRMGQATLDVVFSRGVGSFAADLRTAGGSPTVTLDLPVALGATNVRVTLDSAAVPLQWAETGAGRRVRLELPPGRRHQVVVEWDGGLDVTTRPVPLEPGQRSAGVRVLEFTARGRGWDLLLEGERGREYQLALHGARPLRATGADADAEVLPTATFYEVLRIAFPEGTGRATARVRLSR